MRRIRWIGRGIASREVLLFLLTLLLLFTTGAYHWALKTYRTHLMTVNPVLYPYFVEANVRAYVPTARESYYRLWRTYDWMADGYAPPRTEGVYLRVPVFYVHGNGGSYYCSRSLARFVYEANARLRQRAVRTYHSQVKRHLFHEYHTNATLEPLAEGESVPAWLQHRVEYTLLQEEGALPLLGTEVFAVDYREESSTHSAVITLKEARFLNHSVHLAFNGFLQTYANVSAAPPSALLTDEADNNSSVDLTPTSAKDLIPQDAKKVLKQVEDEYMRSICSHESLITDEQYCELAEQLVKRFSTLERVRSEVQRVRQGGIWIWAESLGGVTALLAAMLAPHLYAGIVMVGTPTRYLPLFFDHASVWLYESLDAATFLRYPASDEVAIGHASRINWPELLSDAKSPNSLLTDLRAVPPVVLHNRLRNTILLSINGGTLDDVIPSISGYLQRSTPRGRGTLVNRSTLIMDGAHRRDVSTETLRGCGAAMDHRGLVYSLQFLQYSADSLVEAALLPEPNAHFGPKAAWPSHSHRNRLFATIVETLDAEQSRVVALERRFEASMHDSPTGGYVKSTDRSAVEGGLLTEICVMGNAPLDLYDVPAEKEEDPISGYFDGATPLNVLIGFTTLPPDQIREPQIRFFADSEGRTPTLSSGVQVRPATLLHLPTYRKGHTVIQGRTLQAAVSFALYRHTAPHHPSTWVWPQFCIQVDPRDQLDGIRSYLQYDKIDTSAFPARANRLPSVLRPLQRSLGAAVQLHRAPGYTLVRGIDSAMLEPHLQVCDRDGSAVFPLVMAGSLHSFYLALRGQHSLAPDEPEHQLQYFYGPFLEDTHNFTYRWKPCSTYPPQFDETYLIYVLADHHGARPEVRLPTYDLLEKGIFFSREFGHWMVTMWPQRWLAVFSMHTGIARLGGAAIVLFFTLFFVMGVLDNTLCATPEQRAALLRSSPFRRIRVLTPLSGIVVMMFVLEVVTGLWAYMALDVCLSSDPPPYVTDAEMTRRMGLLEKTTLILLYGIAPSYRACRYSWIFMQTAPLWTFFVEQMAILCFGVVLAIAFLVIVLAYLALVGGLTWPLRRFLLAPLLRRAPTVFAGVLGLLWVVPTLLLLTKPSIPLCYVDLVGPALLAVPAWMVPRWTRSGHQYRLVVLFFCVACVFPSHFNGLALTIRNSILLRDIPEALADTERYTTSRPQHIIFAAMHTAFASVYGVVLCLLCSEETHRLADVEKRVAFEGAAASTQVECASCGYIWGDFGRRAPRARSFLRRLNTALVFVSLWASLIALRRPLEGSVTLMGNVALIGYLATYLVKEL